MMIMEMEISRLCQHDQHAWIGHKCQHWKQKGRNDYKKHQTGIWIDQQVAPTRVCTKHGLAWHGLASPGQ